MIKPTIGRVVWFWRNGAHINHTFSTYDEKQACAALVTHVWSDSCVNLAVFDHAGDRHSITSVPLVQAHEPKPEPPTYFAAWMPYQVGQAAKAEELEKQMSDRPGVG